MLRVSEAIEQGYDPRTALDDAGIGPGFDRDVLESTLARLRALHAEGRNHVWAYYTRNLVRPVWLASQDGQVDVIVGNPPWLTYNRAAATLRSELEQQSKKTYGIWVGGKYAPHQDVAGLFFTRSVDLYLQSGGIAAMVLPHSALQAGQYRQWRSGAWGESVGVDLSASTPWDLERIEPNTFFPVPACVVFAKKTVPGGSRPLGDSAQCWRGPEGGPFVYESVRLVDTSIGEFASPYGDGAREGASLVPRALFFVNVTESTTAIARGIVKVSPRRSSREKSPWKELPVNQLVDSHIEEEHIWQVHLGETLVPYLLLEPLQAVLPMRRQTWGETIRSGSDDSIWFVDPISLGHRMRGRWRAINEIWEQNKRSNNKLDLLGRIDYRRELSNQLAQKSPIRLVYAAAGHPTAAVLCDSDPLVDYKLFWVRCESLQEAQYLSAIINSRKLEQAVIGRMSKGQFGARDLQRHLWQLPIPAYDCTDGLLQEIATAGAEAADGARTQLTVLQRERSAR